MAQKERNDFLLPNELGWECNDEISKKIDDWMSEAAKVVSNSDGSIDQFAWGVAKAQLTDDVYAIIKKYQEKKK